MSAPAIMVTGGAGYIGSHICKALARAGFLPVTYDNLSTGNRWAVRWGPLVVGDVFDPVRLHEVMRNHRFVAVMHLAASALVSESMQNPALYYRNNTMATAALLDAMRVHSINLIVFASTCAIYGDPGTIPISEKTPPCPVNPYGRSKLFAEQLLADYGSAYNLRYVALRYFNAAGADPDGEIGESRTVETHLIPLTLYAILGRRPPVEVRGSDYSTPDGTAVRDYVHVTDLAAAHVAALNRLLAGAESLSCNLGIGEGYSVRQIIALAESLTGRAVPHRYGPRRVGDPPILIAKTESAAESLDFDRTRCRSIEEIIASAWAWHSRLYLSDAGA